MLAALMLTCVLAAPAAAAERYALIVSGASGDTTYAEQYAGWRAALTKTLTSTLGFEATHLVVLHDGGEGPAAATADGVRRALADLRAKMRPEDLLFVFLIGHGTFDGTDAKFNLVGRDLESAEWAALLAPLPGQIVAIDSTGSSFPFLERLAGPRRIVITATDSAAQRYDTIFPELFIQALGGGDADLDKNGRVSVWEAFIAASAGVRRYYEQRGQLATERALLDDTGDGIGREAGGQGDDGSHASRTYLDPAPPDAAPTDEELLRLLQQRTALEADVDELRQRRPLMTPGEYAKEFEALMVKLARVSRQIRVRGKS